MIWRAALLAALAFTAACAPPPPEPITVEEHRAAVQTWRQWRHDELSKPDGWLSLAGLYWLQPGRNLIGADEAADLPADMADAPAYLGVFDVDGETVRFTAAPVQGMAVDGRPFSTIVARDPESENPAPVITWSTLSWYVIKRGDRLGVRLRDSASPVLTGFAGVANYEIDPAWRIIGRLEKYSPPRMIKVPNILGTVNDTESPAAAVFELEGTTYRLDVWRDEPGDSDWFTAFADATNNEGTYGGGRFIRIDPPDEHGHLVIDFNRAYNPPCVFTAYATCPLPPQQNRLPLRIQAGELDFKSD